MTSAVIQRPLLPLERERPRALYIHVPFCVKRCHYCDFATGPLGDGLADEWMKALVLEAGARLPPGFAPRTIYLGGGTPTELPNHVLERLLGWLSEGFDLEQVEEFTCEANPGTLTPAKLALLRRGGVGRISLGVQSTHDRHLKLMGRIHSADEAVEAVTMVRQEGFSNLSLDLILGLPGSSVDDVRRDVERFVAMAPRHISAYGLTYERGTPFKRWEGLGLLKRLEPEVERQMLGTVRKDLHGAGYRHYEISNFCQPGFSSRHNLVYWRNGAYVGLGPSAASHVAGVRRTNVRSLRGWLESVHQRGGRSRGARERLSVDAKAGETCVLGLRLAAGLSRRRLTRMLGYDPLAGPERATAIQRAAQLCLLEDDGDRVRLTGRGIAVADTLFCDLL